MVRNVCINICLVYLINFSAEKDDVSTSVVVAFIVGLAFDSSVHETVSPLRNRFLSVMEVGRWASDVGDAVGPN